jgi:hypothetical protein
MVTIRLGTNLSTQPLEGSGTDNKSQYVSEIFFNRQSVTEGKKIPASPAKSAGQ